MERFLSLLEKNPRRGTPLDRVYGFHVERGSLDGFIKTYRDRLDKNPNDGTAWLILGLLEFQRGQDAAAVTALRSAEANRPDDPLPSFYLGQALVLVGQPENAAEAFERALARKPARTDLLDIFQALGRVYQRTQKNDQALQVWNRLEALFPGDPRVQEQIASALAEESQPAAALPRFEALAKKATDPFRQVQLAIQAADLKVRLGRSQDALHDFEAMLAKLRPDSWLHREVRRKIEEVFLRNDDQAGLVAYYEQWTKKEPDDVEALVRLGRTLAAMGRAAVAQTWFDKAVKLAPSRRDLRLALISQLVQDQKFAEAAREYQALDQAEPNNPDTLRDWGTLALRDTTKTQPQRKAAAAAIWRKLLVSKPNDPVTTAQVADLLRQAELTDEALELYRKAAQLAPTNPQYHEYIGEYLHNLKRPDEAKAAWAKITEGANRNAKTLARLAEVLGGFGYLKDALAPLTEAVKLEPDSFELRLKLAGLDHRLEKFDDAETQLAAAAKLAEKEEEKDAVLEARVKNDQAAGRVAQRIDGLRKELDAAAKPAAPAWCVLARYLEADTKLPEAVRAADRAVEIDPRSIPAWTLAARVRESAGSLGDAAAALRRLAEIDRRNRTEHLTGVARLEARLGRIDEALKAGRDLLAAAPGNPESYEFFAQLCFGLGRPDEGLDALRRAVRLDPNDTKITLTLASTLAEQYRTDEAIEMYWRAFDKSDDLDGKIGTVSRLTELYLQRNQLDRLFTRLQHQERDAAPAANQARGRDVAICMAQAYASSGDLGSARAELERLLATDTRDTRLIQQLSKLAEEEGDLESAARYQKQQIELAPSDDGSSRLAQLFARSGELEEAEAVWSKMASGKSERHRIFAAIDSLLGQKKPAPVFEITEAMVRKDPHDWEAIYRQGVALVDLGKPDIATQRFQALLDLTTADDELSSEARSRTKDPKVQAASSMPSAVRRATTLPIEQRVAMALTIRRATGLDNRFLISARGAAQAWAPGDFGQARMASLGWLTALTQKKGKTQEDAFVAGLRQAAEKAPADLRAVWDWYYSCLLRYDNVGAFAAGKLLSRSAPNDPLALWAYLNSAGGRDQAAGQRNAVVIRPGEQPKDSTPPLEAAELDHVMMCFRSLKARRPELAQAQILQNVLKELKRARRADEEERLYRESIDGATQLGQIASAIGLAAEKGDVDGLLSLCDRYERLQGARGQQYYSAVSFYFQGPALSIGQCMTQRAGRKAHDDILRILDHQLAAVERRQARSSGAPRASQTVARRVGTTYYQNSNGTMVRVVQVAFPTPNEIFDESAIQVLRSAFDIYKRDDLMSDLVSHFRRQEAEAKTPAQANYPRLALASILWWNDDKEEAIAEFTKVAEASKPESDLRLDLAELLEQQGDRASALAMTDSVQPLDNARMKRREELALKLSVTNGDLDRARQAAERLFGLRLDTDTQVRLAGQMHQLGLHELAEAVLGRARRRAGNKASELVGMMSQYQRQGQLDVAVQVAMQILMSTNATRPTNPNIRLVDAPEASRAAAISVLARSGRLPKLIERVNDQIKKTPRSVGLHQTLADYYQASGQTEKARAELTGLIALRPDDNGLRLQVAQKLVQERQAAAAVEQFKVILAKEPAILYRYFSQVSSAFQQAGKTDELFSLLDQLDFRQFGAASYAFNLISNLMSSDSTGDRALGLLKKAWEAFPDDRSLLLNLVSRRNFGQSPELAEMFRDAVIPSPAAFQPANQWNMTFSVNSYSSDGRVTSPCSLVLDSAAGQGQLEELRTQIETARRSIPAWTAGDVLLALVDCRLGRFDQARRGIRSFIDAHDDQAAANDVNWIVGQQLENHAATRDLAYELYESSVSAKTGDPFIRLQFNYGPAGRLISLYQQDHRLDDARRLLVGYGKPVDLSDPSYPEDYLLNYRMQGLGTAAAKLMELGFAADAVFLFNQAIGLANQIRPDSQYADNPEMQMRGFRDGLTRALAAVTPGEMASSLTGLLKAEDAPVAVPTGPKSVQSAAEAKSTVKPRNDGSLLDMMVLAHPRELDKAKVRSLLAEAVAAEPRKGKADQTKESEQLSAALEAARTKHPDDFGVAICEALRELSSSAPAGQTAAVSRLVRLVEKTPLEPLEPGERANARQRAAAAHQVPLWLVARACWNQKDKPERAKLAANLATRALEAARRQTDNTLYLAMIREQGELALERGDKRTAEADWARMLDLVVNPPQSKIKKANPQPARTSRPAPPATPAAPRSGALAPSERRDQKSPLNEDRFPPRSLAHHSPPDEEGGRGKTVKSTAIRGKASTSHSLAPSGERVGVRGPALPVRLASFQAPTPAPAPAAQEKTKAGRTKAASGKAAPGPDGNPAAARRRPPGAPRSNLPILTLDRFEQAMQIARLAAAHDLPELSLRAVRDALRAGPPVVPTNPNEGRMVIRARVGTDDGPVDPAAPRVVANLFELEAIWQKHKFAPAVIYEALRDVVLPPARPTELFLYAPPLDMNALRRPKSAGALLAAWAVRAGKAGELKQAIAARQGQPMAELPASILSAQLALATGDPAAAAAALDALAARMKTDTSRTTSELACHVAIPALDRTEPPVAKAALVVLDSCTKGFESATQPEPLSSLLLMLARRQFSLGDAAGGRKRLEAYVEAMEKNTVRYAGDYPNYLRKQQLSRVADEYARAGLAADALAALGQFLDAPAYSGGDPAVDETLVRVLRLLSSSPAKEQYEALRAWSMPQKDRRSVRILTSLQGGQGAPEVLRRFAGQARSQTNATPDRRTQTDRASTPDSLAAANEGGSLSTATALIDAARRAGTLDQLAETARVAALLKADKKVENAEALHLLIELARGQGVQVVPVIENRLAVLIQENNAYQGPVGGAPAPAARRAASERLVFPELDFLLARAALPDANPAVSAAGLRLSDALMERAKKVGSRPGLAQLRALTALVRARKEGAPNVLAAPNLAWWHPATTSLPYERAAGSTRAYWTAQDGLVAHLAGSAADLLLFDYPLTGDYEFSVAAFDGPWAESAVTHNSLVIEPGTGEGNARIFPIGHVPSLNFPWRLNRRDAFNSMTVKVSPGKVRYIANGHQFYQDDDPGPTSPWLGLYTHSDRHSVWKSFKLEGKPVIPRELRLCEDERLEGWISNFYNETQPSRLTEGMYDEFGRVINRRGSVSARRAPAIAVAGANARKTRQPVEVDAFDWAAADGVIHGRRADSGPQNRRSVARDTGATEADQSRLYYFRPLQDGDVVTYEFFYDPGQVMVHPALDRLVFLCEPEGVRLHWMTTGGDDLSGLTADNVADEPENRRGPKALPLEPGRWNSVKLSVDAGKATLDLNGQTIFERPLEPGLSRQFGFFHYKDQTAARARNIVLRGKWPQALTPEQMASPIAVLAGSGSVAERRARIALIDETFFALQAGDVLAEARKLAPNDRFERLAGWVLPAADRPAWRLSGDLAPSFPAPACAKEAGTTNAGAASGNTKPAGANRLETGAEITAPALELVATAQATGKLDDLVARVQNAKPEGAADADAFERGRLALLGLIQLARGDDAAALKTITTIEPLLKKLAADAPVHARWPELLVASRALEHQPLFVPAAALLDIMLDQTRKRARADGPYQTHSNIWDQVLSHARARVHLLALDDKDKTEGRPLSAGVLGVPGWARVTHNRAETRGQGLPLPQWDTRGGELTHHPGHDLDMMYLNVPLRGDFQLDCELSSAVGRKVRVLYGGVGVSPLDDPKKLERFKMGSSFSEVALSPPLEKLGDWYPFRLVVKGGRVTAFMNGRNVFTAAAPPEGDPWLALLWRGTETGSARKISITGNPSIPEKLKLSALPDLTGWLADEFGKPPQGSEADWEQRGEEITAGLRDSNPGSKQESVLRYHRPLLEDGQIAFEFYFDPGKEMVYPALDRLAFLIEPDGIKIHRLTDGAHERSALAADNACEEPQSRRGTGSIPLKAHAWNRLSLRVAGDRLTIELNGQPILERPIEPENQRTFGLFHFADETAVRVRNVTYEGNWPKALPESVRHK